MTTKNMKIFNLYVNFLDFTYIIG